MEMLIQGQIVHIDNNDYKLVKGITWTFNKTSGYMQAWLGGRTVYMHRLIMNAGEGQMVDHINGNKLDNRRSNLRPCTQSQNLCNKSVYKNNPLGIKGVRKHRDTGKYRACITYQGKTHHIGIFSSIKDASRAYDGAARILHGPFARLNNI